MNWITTKLNELTSNIWLKLIGLIPMCFFSIEEREKIMIFALMVIVIVDCLMGAMVAAYIDGDFDWGLLSKKFSKKFLLYFFTLGASFVISKGYDFVEWWFYVIGMIVTFSEFGSLMTKSKRLGLPVGGEYIDFLNKKVDRVIKDMIGME